MTWLELQLRALQGKRMSVASLSESAFWGFIAFGMRLCLMPGFLRTV